MESAISLDSCGLLQGLHGEGERFVYLIAPDVRKPLQKFIDRRASIQNARTPSRKMACYTLKACRKRTA